MESTIDRYKNELIRLKYASNSIKVYMQCFNKFLLHFKARDYRNISDDDIKNFLLFLVETDNISSEYQNQIINAVKFYYEKVLHRPRKTYNINRPRKETKLPVVISQGEVKAMFDVCTNLKHKAILLIIYSAGLRESEVINLQVSDIDSKNMVIHIRQAKGAKDRLAPLSAKMLEVLRDYYKEYKPKLYLFEGQFSYKYSATSIQSIIKQLAAKANVNRRVYPHLIRHCFATHSFEAGTELALLQKVLGHKNIKTTMIYTHISTQSISGMSTPDQNF